jgi:hypothetical protein
LRREAAKERAMGALCRVSQLPSDWIFSSGAPHRLVILAIVARDFCGYGHIAASLILQLAPMVDLALVQCLGINHFKLSADALGSITGAAIVAEAALEKMESPLSRNVSRSSKA